MKYLSGPVLWLLLLLQQQEPVKCFFIPKKNLQSIRATTPPTTTSSSTSRFLFNTKAVPQHAPPIPPADKLIKTTIPEESTATPFRNLLLGGEDGINTNLQELISKVREQLETSDARVMEQITQRSMELKEWLHSSSSSNLPPNVERYYDILSNQLSTLLHGMNISPTIASVILTLGTTLAVLSITSSSSNNNSEGITEPYPMKKYDPDSAKIYFRNRIPLMISRGLEVLLNSLSFGIGVLQDKINNDTSIETQNKRGIELAQLLTKLGPTYIKVGQSLSIRTDLLSPSYVRGLASLQDQVPPFSSKIAYEILEEQWGKPITEVVSKISPEPIAAASLGQVYKATLKDGTEVAIKVQRPNIMNQIALDMHLLAEIAPIVKKVFGLNSDTVGTVNAWGIGFVDELDYLQEAKNAQFFSSQIQKTPLKDVVFAPSVVDELSTNEVLVSEWIDGVRLDKSSSQDVTLLCSIAMNTYLTMLLEVGLLHCDPHPGNLLRSTKDGRLCILDWGMVTKIDKNIQLTLIEHVAHLTSADYDEIPRDLLLLDFIPKDKEHLINDSDIVSVLASIYGQWTGGGGAASVNVNEVVNQLQDLTATKGNIFQVPPYFAYIAKSFSVLEGIGLSNDAKYSIINECLPYISQRLLTDKENMGPALSTYIFGPEKNDIKKRFLDYDRIEQLVTGFGNYTSSSAAIALLSSTTAAVAETQEEAAAAAAAAAAASVRQSKAGGAATEQPSIMNTTQTLLEKSADQILDIVFAEEETPFQKILVEQLAKIIASTSRSLLTQIRESSGTLPSGRTVLGTLLDPLGLFRTSPLVRMNEQDEYVIETTRKLILLVQDQQQKLNVDPNTISNKMSNEDIIRLSTILASKVWQRRVGILRTGNLLTKELLTLFADKLEAGERDTRKLKPTPAPAAAAALADKKEDKDLKEDIKSRMIVEESDPTTAIARRRARITATTEAAAATLNRRRESNLSETLQTRPGRRAAPSSRLANARNLLNELNRREDADYYDIIEETPSFASSASTRFLSSRSSAFSSTSNGDTDSGSSDSSSPKMASSSSSAIVETKDSQKEEVTVP